MKKKILLALSAVFALTMLMFTSVYADDITITVNGNVVETDTAPVIINDRTMVPLRAVSAALNCGVGWNGDTQGVTILKAPASYDSESQMVWQASSPAEEENEKLIMCWIGKENAFLLDGFSLGKKYSMDSPPVIVNDRTLVPIRAISELIGATVNWNGDTRTVNITATLPKVNMDEENEVAQGLGDYYSGILLEMYDVYTGYADGNAETVNAEIGLAGGGVIQIELYPEIAPASVNNFVELANKGAYDGTVFHRVIEGFMIQGGAFEPNGNQRSAGNIEGEFFTNGVFNLIPHKRGAVSMARADDPNSASNQFFIMHRDASYLDGSYAAFGQVTSGMEYVDKIAAAATDSNNKPVEDQVISYVKILN